jgi:hypothetical protein
MWELLWAGLWACQIKAQLNDSSPEDDSIFNCAFFCANEMTTVNRIKQSDMARTAGPLSMVSDCRLLIVNRSPATTLCNAVVPANDHLSAQAQL